MRKIAIVFLVVGVGATPASALPTTIENNSKPFVSSEALQAPARGFVYLGLFLLQ